MRRLLVFSLIAAILYQQTALAVGKIELPAGEQVVGLEWNSAARLVLVTNKQSLLALRLADPATGEVTVIPFPRGSASLDSKVKTSLSPSGNGFAAVVPANVAGQPAKLLLFRINNGKLDEVNLRRIDRDFIPALLAWKADGTKLFVAAAPYTGPEIKHAVIAVETGTGSVQEVISKDKIDLISQMAYVANPDRLVLKCRGIGGEYPAEPLIALVESSSENATVLHAEASELNIEVVPDGTLFLNAPQSARERWILLPGANELRRWEPRLPMTNWTSSADGQWIAGIADGRSLRREQGKTYALLQPRSGKTSIPRIPSRLARFSPDGRTVALVSFDGSAVTVIPVPVAAE